MTMNLQTTSDISSLPDEIPIFPLTGVLLLPRGQLPLNIFEPRYIAMIDDALKSHRMIGMIQPRDATDRTGSENALFTTGCAGRIISFTETEDGRYEITLKGVSRFVTKAETPNPHGGYRKMRVEWDAFHRDLDDAQHINLDRPRLKDLLRSYFDMEGMECDWATIDGVGDDNLITCLSMVCPLDANEKQALLEARCGKTRSDLFMTLLEMATRDTSRARPDQCKTKCH